MNNLVSVSKRFGNFNGEKACKDDKVYDSILDVVGHTPIVKLNRIPKDHGVACDIYVKCEYMNPVGSIKERIALAMINDAKMAGAVKENTEFVEPTSGNTGIGIALNAAILGKKCTIVLGEKNSTEKVSVMQLMGAEVLKTKGSTSQLARQIKDNNPDNVVMVNQFANHVNPRIHYDSTGPEIVSAMEQVDMAVMSAGTGGTISGIGLKLKEAFPDCLVAAAEPDGSVMFNTLGKDHPYLVEGVGHGKGAAELIVLDRSEVDHFEVVNDKEAFLMARELARKEGILCGGSGGLAVAAAIKAAKTLGIGAGKRVIVILPDGIRNYMSKFVCDQWMEAHLFIDPPKHTMRWWNQPITSLNLSHKYPMLDQSSTCEAAMEAMEHVNIAVIVDDKKHFLGVVSKNSLRNFATNPTKLPNVKNEDFNFMDPVSKHLAKDCYTLSENTKGKPTIIGLLSRILDITAFVVIVQEEHDSSTGLDYMIPKGVVTADDVLEYIYENRNY